MQIGIITFDGQPVGTVTLGDDPTIVPDVLDTIPLLDDAPSGHGASSHHSGSGRQHHAHHVHAPYNRYGNPPQHHGKDALHDAARHHHDAAQHARRDPMPSSTATSSNDYLRERRQRMAEEINRDPELRSQVRGMLATEGENDPVPVMESMLNRGDYTGHSVRSMLHSGFYGPINRGELPGAQRGIDRDPERRARLDHAIDAALGGSNLIRGATDQGLPADPNGRWQGGRIVRGGNVFNDWGGGPGGHAGAWSYRQSLMRGVEQAERNAPAERLAAGETIP